MKPDAADAVPIHGASVPIGKMDSYMSKIFLSENIQRTLGILIELFAGLEEGLPTVSPPRP